MKLATDESIRPEHLPVVPLLQAISRSGNPHDRWWERNAPGDDVLVAAAHELVVDIGEADAVIVPMDWYWVRGKSWASRPDRQLARRCADLADRARALGKPVIVFFTGDRSCDTVGIEDAVVFREGPYRSRLGPLDRPFPAFVEDLVHARLDGTTTILERPDRATVGFCGLARHRTGAGVRWREVACSAVTLVREREIHPSQFSGENLRAQAIDVLREHPRIDDHFIVRSDSVYFGKSDVAAVRAEFVDNLNSNAYSLCIRGSGNYSYRLYEALCLGRIPVIVDTDLALPVPDRVPWREIAVWHDGEDFSTLPDAIGDFHDSLSDDDFVGLQHELRRLWLEYLRPAGWLTRLDAAIGGRETLTGSI